MADEVAAVSGVYELILWAVPQVSKFPREHRFTLGERIVTRLYHLLELLVAASYTKNKTEHLAEANLEVSVLRYLVRLAKDLRVLSVSRYEHASKLLVAIGKQVGGWQRAEGAKGLR